MKQMDRIEQKIDKILEIVNQPFGEDQYGATVYADESRYKTNHNCPYNLNYHLHIRPPDKLQCNECGYTIRVNREGEILETIREVDEI